MERLSLRDKLGYASASIGDAAEYTFIGSFLMFFLTTIAGIQPAAAGTISILAAVWDAVLSPVIGYLSDHSKSRLGRRRFYILCFTIPLFVVTILLFTSVECSYSLKIIYYGIMTFAFWTCYTGFFIPYYALGAEYTDDYNERTVLRSYASFFNLLGVCAAVGMPPVMVKIFANAGLSEHYAWAMTALIISVISIISILITFRQSKERDVPIEKPEATGVERVSVKDMFKEYMEVLAMRPVRIALTTSLIFLIAYTIMFSDVMFFLTYIMGYSGGAVSAALLVRCLMGMALLPPTMWLCKKTDKRTALIIVFIVGAVGVSVMRPVDVHGILAFGILLFLLSICTSLYWQIMPAIFYDLCEYDEYVNGKRREGAIVSIQGFVESVASGIGAQILGIILQLAGFNADLDVQSVTAQTWIFHCVTIVPAVLLLAAAFTMYIYPITREVFEETKQKLNERKQSL